MKISTQILYDGHVKSMCEGSIQWSEHKTECRTSSSKNTESKLSYSLHIKDLPVLIFPSVFMQDTSKFHDMFKYKSQE